MAVLSLIDDFAFPNRVLHAGHGYNNLDQKYTLQVITGISVHATNNSRPSRPLMEKAEATFLGDAYPFIGITNYKINNGLLIGNGIELLELIKQSIEKLSKRPKYKSAVELICIDCFSNHELTVLYFSKELNTISSFINATRTLKLSNIEKMADTIAQDSLLYDYLKSDTDTDLLASVKDSHLFSTTYSYLGYKMGLELEDTKMTFQYHWDLKPGHCSVFKNAVISELGQENIRYQITPGSDMLVIEQTKSIRIHISDLEKIEKLHISCIRKQRVCLVFDEQGLDDGFDGPLSNHPELVRRLQACGFGKKELQELREALDCNRVSKVLKERTLKMYETFNDCITDPLFFNYFIELKNNLRGIEDKIMEYGKDSSESESLENFHVWLDGMITNFEKAYHNRFHQSSRMKNISDFNLEYNGGIQQLISAYDVGYKSVSEAFTEKYFQNFVFVSGYERVSSDRNSLLINIFHITYPELYAATIWKEGANFYWEVTKRTKGNQYFQNILLNDSLVLEENALIVLRARISSSSEFDPSSYVHTLMLSCVNQRFIHYLLTDAIVFNYGYLADFDLFNYYYWTYFCQMSHFYDRDGEMNPAIFIKFLVRLEFIKHFYPGESDNFDKWIDPKFRELYFAHAKDITSFISILLNELKKFDFPQYVSGLIVLFFYKEDCMRIDLLENVSDSEKEEKKQALKKDYIENELSKNLLKRRDEAEKNIPLFLEGKIIEYSRKEVRLSFIRNLFYTYLRAMKSLSVDDLHCIGVLERNQAGKVVSRPTEYHHILADPLGGMFIYDKETRIKYFKSRAVLYKTLWGIGLITKKKYVDIR